MRVVFCKLQLSQIASQASLPPASVSFLSLRNSCSCIGTEFRSAARRSRGNVSRKCRSGVQFRRLTLHARPRCQAKHGVIAGFRCNLRDTRDLPPMFHPAGFSRDEVRSASNFSRQTSTDLHSQRGKHIFGTKGRPASDDILSLYDPLKYKLPEDLTAGAARGKNRNGE